MKVIFFAKKWFVAMLNCLFLEEKYALFYEVATNFSLLFFFVRGRSRARLVFTLNMRVADTKEIFAD